LNTNQTQARLAQMAGALQWFGSIARLRSNEKPTITSIGLVNRRFPADQD
jgi:hypothetical protein